MGAAAGGLGGPLAGAAAGITALGATVGFLFAQGVEATGVLQRFDTVLGDMADEVLRVDVGDLNENLDDLAIKLGSDDEALRDASASLFQFGINSGASRQAAATFTKQIDALAARAVALNPALGSVGDVAESMALRIQRGGRFAATFQLSLTAAEIEARALADTLRTAIAKARGE